jgi:ADP-ribosylglycohydrolase
MITKRQAAVWGAFVADALSLGVHWVYNTGVIDKKFGRVEHYHDPLTSFHKGKKAGDFTHYGDQTLVLLETLDKGKGFDALRFAQSWRDFFSDYTGYFDKATKATLENMDSGGELTQSASTSDDLAGASRMAPLVAVYGDNLDQLVRTARSQTAITHGDERVVASADFFARTVLAILNGKEPVPAMEAALNEQFADNEIAPLVRMGLQSKDRDTRETIDEFGQMCSVEVGLPGAVHLVARHGSDFKTAMVENVMAGGDSSARGMLAGMVIAAAHGMDAIPDEWISGLNAGERIRKILEQF